MSTQVLLTGSTGLLGQGLLQSQPATARITVPLHIHQPVGTSAMTVVTGVDLRNEARARDLFATHTFDVVIHAMSMGGVDDCEQQQDAAWWSNVQATRYLLRSCVSAPQPPKLFVFISSNAVFSGTQAPYGELATVDPINYYGHTKVLAEELVRQSGLPWLIIRPVLLFGWQQPDQRLNPVTWILQTLKSGTSLQLVDDIYNNPLLNTAAAQAIWQLVAGEYRGVVHLAGGKRVSRYELGQLTAEVFGLDASLLAPVKSAVFPSLAPRMPDTTFDTSLVESLVDFHPLSVRQYLREMQAHQPPWTTI